MAHYSAPRLQSEATDAHPSFDFPRWTRLVFGAIVAHHALLMVLGHFTFGSRATPLLLDAYAAGDVLAIPCWCGLALSLLTMVMPIFVGLRDSVLSLLPRAGSPRLTTPVSIALWALLAVATASVSDISLLLSLRGATFGVLCIYVLPALLSLRSRRLGGGRPSRAADAAAGATLAGGAALSILGVMVTLKKV